MSYLVLARKYRPQIFDELVGQEHVMTTLVNALSAKRLAHAYIFSGPRGCGKTTTARLLAKALNCDKGPTAKPCGTCAQCQEIGSGASPDDVLEIDGASNRGIDQIRELRDTVKYAPARSRFRIFIIDEAHQITEAGFNALLKTLEEPPAHAVFMMATTEPQKIPGTIVSRCQRFQLKPIPLADTQKQLQAIIQKEKLTISDDALFEIARAAHGSLRDALSLVDQVIAYSPQGVTDNDIRSLLGLLPQKTIRDFAAVLQEGHPEKVLQAIQKAIEEGFDLFQLAHDLLDYFHHIFLWKSGIKDMHAPDKKELEAQAAHYAFPQLERNLRIISRCTEQMRRSESHRVTFELSCLELSQKSVSVDDLLDRLESLEKKLTDDNAPSIELKKKATNADPLTKSEVKKQETQGKDEVRSPASHEARRLAHSKAEVKKRETENTEKRDLPSETEGNKSPKPDKPSDTSAPSHNDISSETNHLILSQDRVKAAWAQMREDVGQKKPSLEHFVATAGWEIKSHNALHIACYDEFQKTQIAAHINFIAELLQKYLPNPFAIHCVMGKKQEQEKDEIQSEKGGLPQGTPASAFEGRSPKSEGKSQETLGKAEVRSAASREARRLAPSKDEGKNQGATSPEPPMEYADEDEAEVIENDTMDEPMEQPEPPPPADKRETASSQESPVAPSLADPGVKKFIRRFPGKLTKAEPSL